MIGEIGIHQLFVIITGITNIKKKKVGTERAGELGSGGGNGLQGRMQQ